MSVHAATADAFQLALIGVPNSGKTALFNRLTGSRQKVANYAGVTVERKEGMFVGPSRERSYRVLDLPGAYSLTPTTLDEAITRDLLLGRLSGETAAATSSYAWSTRPTCGSICDSCSSSSDIGIADDRGAQHERSRSIARIRCRSRRPRARARRARGRDRRGGTRRRPSAHRSARERAAARCVAVRRVA